MWRLHARRRAEKGERASRLRETDRKSKVFLSWAMMLVVEEEEEEEEANRGGTDELASRESKITRRLKRT